MSLQLQVLLVEDNLGDVDLILELLPESGPVSFLVVPVERLSSAIEQLSRKDFDLILLDLCLPDSRGIDTFLALQRVVPLMPIIVLTGNDDQEIAIQALRMGAQDYLLKGRVTGDLLVQASRYALERKRIDTALRKEEARYRLLFETMAQGVVYQSASGQILSANPAAEKILSLSPDQIQGRTSTDPRWMSIHENYSPYPGENHPAMVALHTGERAQGIMGIFNPERESYRWIAVDATPLFEPKASKPFQVYTTFVDITERKESEAALRQSEERFRELFRSMNSGVAVYTAIDEGCDFILRDLNNAGERISQVRREEVLGHKLSKIFPGAEEMGLMEVIRQVWASGTPGRLPETLYTDAHLSQWVEIYVYRLSTGELVTIYNDVTERRKTEEQLLAAQRMEAVGRLAGGVAHDFNNLLSVILNFSSLALDDLGERHPLYNDILEIHMAGERAASLTRQLLAFSHKQVLQPDILCINETIRDMKGMLRSLIAENIELVTNLALDLPEIMADRGQIEQVILNLVVNSRDAMPFGGRLTIETTSMVLDELQANRQKELQAGSYALLSLTDTGIGIDEKTMAHIFEPFFTTKEKDKGTGLGLAMVYGIVKQSNGHIEVQSQVGQGTTFRIYLPQTMDAEKRDVAPSAPRAQRSTRRGETILVAEDEDAVRRLIQRILSEEGYRVLVAANGEESLLICEREEVNLLITDVVMPGMSGPQLAERLSLLHPAIRVLYLSGYTDSDIVHHGVLDTGTPFLNKPFSAPVLNAKIREVLGGDSHQG